MSSFPKPGQPVRGSKTGAPLMALFDLLGRSWAMGTIWQLSEGGPATFRELQQRCEGVSPTVLNKRLKELRAAGLIEHASSGYALTPIGRRLFEKLKPMKSWADKWARSFSD
ncbi:MAG: helix-turn-helix domain-containing protein [Pseudomonadota bacterium]